MLPIVDFPPEVLSQIFGSKYSSYLVIKIWLCGSSQLNKKLSNGLTYLNLALHQFATCKFPRLVFEFQNLRHFAIRSLKNMLNDPSDWTVVMKSLPKTLDSFYLHCPDSQHCLSDFEANKENPPALNLASLLPCLQMLSITADSALPSDRFAYLPPTLTELTADIRLIYNSPDKSLCRPLSQLPRGILRMNGYFDWGISVWQREMPEAIELLRADLLNAPPDLQYFPTTSLPASVLAEDFRFPQSLTKLNMPRHARFGWTPSIALQVTSNSLQVLSIAVDTHLFANPHHNWASELPRSLTNLSIRSEAAIDFTSFSHCLPPNLAHLSILASSSSDVTSPIGDWSCIEASEVENGKHWPNSLTVMKLERCLNASFDIAKLPRTLLDLSMSISKYSIHVSESIIIDSQRLPPLLTELNLVCSRPSKIQLSNLQCLTMLTKCRLTGSIAHPEEDSALSVSTESSIGSALSMTPLYTSQHLTTLFVPSWHCDWFKLLPRGLDTFQAETLPGLAESPLLATHDVFKDLPTSLLYLIVRNGDEGIEATPKIPPQRLDHLSSLYSLAMEAAIVPSEMIRMLPASLLALQLQIEEWNESDHLHFPPRIELLMTSGWMNAPMSAILQSLPLVTLSGLGRFDPGSVSQEHRVAIQQRVAHVAKHQ